MKFTEKYDYLYRQMIANLPVTGMAWLRHDFTKWWHKLGKAVDSHKPSKVSEMKTNNKGQVLIDLDVETEMEYHNGFWCVPISVLRGHNIIIVRKSHKEGKK